MSCHRCQNIKVISIHPRAFHPSPDLRPSDPLKLPFELPAQPMQLLRGEAAPEWFRDAKRSVAAADGFLIVTPEYFGSPSPVLINMLNHFPMASYRHRPVGIACYSLSKGPAPKSLRMLKTLSKS